MPKEYRGRIRILYDILHAVSEEPGIATTRLLYRSNLSHERLQEYLAELKSKGLVEERDEAGKRAYHLPEAGIRFLAELRRIQSFMADFGLEM